MTESAAERGANTIPEQFDRLMDELFRKDLRRTHFCPWEIEILVDIASSRVRMAVLREYRIAVQFQLRNGASVPMKLSDYLKLRERQNKRSGGGT